MTATKIEAFAILREPDYTYERAFTEAATVGIPRHIVKDMLDKCVTYDGYVSFVFDTANDTITLKKRR